MADYGMSGSLKLRTGVGGAGRVRKFIFLELSPVRVLFYSSTPGQSCRLRVLRLFYYLTYSIGSLLSSWQPFLLFTRNHYELQRFDRERESRAGHHGQ
jgi:hypothetical protein